MAAVTKTERLQELRVLNQIEKEFDKFFDFGWREFVKDIRRQNEVSNIRMFKILVAIKGEQFVKDVMDFMTKTRTKHHILNTTRTVKGIKLSDSRYGSIPFLWVEKHPSGSYNNATYYIQIKADRWLTFVA